MTSRLKSLRKYYRTKAANADYRQQFVNQILNQPNDGLGWGLFADWLDETGGNQNIIDALRAVGSWLVPTHEHDAGTLQKIVDYLHIDVRGAASPGAAVYRQLSTLLYFFTSWLNKRPDVAAV